MHRTNDHDDGVSSLTDLIVQEVKDYAVFLLDDTGHVRSWNEGAALIKGYRAEEVIGRHFELFYTDEDRARGQPLYEMNVARARGRYEDEGWRVRKGGLRFWCNEIITALHDESGRPHGFLKIARDLSSRKKAEDELRESEARHRLLVENVRDYAVFMTDPGGTIMTWNPGAQRVFGYAEDEIVGRHGAILFTTEDVAADEHDKELATAVSEGRASDDRWQVRKGGERFWASGVTASIRDPGSGALRGFVKVPRPDRAAALRGPAAAPPGAGETRPLGRREGHERARRVPRRRVARVAHATDRGAAVGSAAADGSGQGA